MNKYLVLISFCLFCGNEVSNAQVISKISEKICDSIKSSNYDNSLVEIKQAEIYSTFFSEYIQKQKDLNIENSKNEINSLNYKITRELNKTCENFKIKKISILPFSSLIEIDSAFSIEQRKKITDLAKEISLKNKMEILVLSIDDLYPFSKVDTFAINKLIDWKIGEKSEKGGTIIVFSKKLRLMNLSTTETGKQYLNAENIKKIANEIMIPQFKNNNYFDGIYKSLIEIKETLK